MRLRARRFRTRVWCISTSPILLRPNLQVVVAEASSFLGAVSDGQTGSPAPLGADTAIVEGFDLNVKVYLVGTYGGRQGHGTDSATSSRPQMVLSMKSRHDRVRETKVLPQDEQSLGACYVLLSPQAALAGWVSQLFWPSVRVRWPWMTRPGARYPYRCSERLGGCVAPHYCALDDFR